MNIPFSHKTLSRYLDGIPEPKRLSDIFLQYICEVEGTEVRGDDTVFELKITPDRGDMLSYLGIAREIAIYSDAKFKNIAPKEIPAQETTKVSVDVVESKLCTRYIARVVQGVDNRQSPAWLCEALEASGQRSINALVDVTNFVMLETGQPMHAFDTARLHHDKNGEVKISVRKANPDEKIETLDGKDIVLPENVLVIADGVRALAIAGVKGGAHAGVGDETESVILESAVFNPVAVRKASKAVGITTDSSRRFEHSRSPEITRVAMDRAVEILLEIFPDARAGVVVDEFPHKASLYRVGVSAHDIERLVGVSYDVDSLARDLGRLAFPYVRVKDVRAKVVESARSAEGAVYKRGASVLRDAPHAFDCASLSAWAYVTAGVAIPRVSIDQFVFSHTVSENELKPGDLIFTNTGEIKTTQGEWYSQVLEKMVKEAPVRTETLEYMPGTAVPHGIDHVGIYLGDGMVCHAGGEQNRVVIEELKDSKSFTRELWFASPIQDTAERFVVEVPPERFDVRIGADIAEEVVRLMGYDKVPTTALSNTGFTPKKNGMYDATLRACNTLVPLGFSQIFTYVFRKEGNVEVSNPMAEGISFLRSNLSVGMKEALIFNARNAPFLGVDQILQFEIGTVFGGVGKETVQISLGASVTKSMKQAKREAREQEVLLSADKALEEALDKKLSWHKDGNVWECVLPEWVGSENTYEPLMSPKVAAPYRTISVYPFMLRDIAMWSNNKLSQNEILQIIRTEAGPLLVRDGLFDIFTKDFDGVMKTSYAFNLVFQSYERTLSDAEINEIMARIAGALSKQGLEVR